MEGNNNTKKSVEQTYRKLAPLEHILLRPDTYVGSTVAGEYMEWVCDGNVFVQRLIEYVPAMYKIFDEVLVNASDHCQRNVGVKNIAVEVDAERGMVAVQNDGAGIPVKMHGEHGVWVPELIFGHLLSSSNYDDSEKKTVGGRNGYGAKLTNIFSTRFVLTTADDAHVYVQEFRNNMRVTDPPRITANRNPKKQWTRIEFYPDFARLNMPSLQHSADLLALMRRRTYDIAAVTGVRVTFNKEPVPVKSFRQYCQLVWHGLRALSSLTTTTTTRVRQSAGSVVSACSSMCSDEPKKQDDDVDDDDGDDGVIIKKEEVDGVNLPTPPPGEMVYERLGERWEVVIMASPTGNFEQVSLVNGIFTSRGGTHVKYITDLVVEALTEKIKTSRNKALKNRITKGSVVRCSLFVCVNCLIDNPAFDSQTKETLITQRKQFGSVVSLPPTFVQRLAKSAVMTALLRTVDTAEAAELRKTDGAKRRTLLNIPKLDDANWAGTKRSRECTLILTEGDSAKATAVAGLSVVGRDRYGVFPLRGKVLNVRDATPMQIRDNAEIRNLIQILGLRSTETYEDLVHATHSQQWPLRYGHIMIMTDQDEDGSHIKGLLINLLETMWPALVRTPGFVEEFITQLVKVTNKRDGRTLSFFSYPEYQRWKEANNNGEGWTVKFYKGLGTSSAAEAKQYFEAIAKHHVRFVYQDDEDRAALELAFAKDRMAADRRKQWILSTYSPNVFVEYTMHKSLHQQHQQQRTLRFRDFVNRELVLFSMADVVRSVPSVVDGMKPGQRKVLYAAFKRRLNSEIKVAQLAGYVAEHTSYHHGEQSLASTIINMAQDFVGSNNMNLLMPNGQFGTRLQGGKDAASSRYTFTQLHPHTRALFVPADDALLKYLDDDGMSIEPEFYVPIIPMVLVNGASGIGTGWSTEVPCFNPMDIIANVRRMLHGQPMQIMHPFYRNFSGAIQPIITNSHEEQAVAAEAAEQPVKYTTHGVVNVEMKKNNVVELRIRELPVGTWTETYKEFLTSLTVAPAERRKMQKSAAQTADAAAEDDDDAGGNGGEKKTKKSKKTSSAIEFCINEFEERHTEEKVDFVVTMAQDMYECALRHPRGGLEGAFKLTNTLTLNNMHLFAPDGKIRRYETPLDIMREHYGVRLTLYEQRRQHMLDELQKELVVHKTKSDFIEAVNDGRLVLSNRKMSELAHDMRTCGFADDVHDMLLGMRLNVLTAEEAARHKAACEAKMREYEHIQQSTPQDMWLADLDALERMLSPSLLANTTTNTSTTSGSSAKKQVNSASVKKSKSTAPSGTQTTIQRKRTVSEAFAMQK